MTTADPSLVQASSAVSTPGATLLGDILKRSRALVVQFATSS